MTLSACWCLWVIFSGDATGDMRRTEEDQAIVAGHVTQMWQRPSNHPEMVYCKPLDAPEFAKDWLWFCPKAK